MLLSVEEETLMDEATRILDQEELPSGPEKIRALASACALIQLNIKLGARLLARTAPLTWSTEQMFNTFEIGEKLNCITLI